MAGIYFDAGIDGDQLQRDINEINRKIQQMTSGVESSGERMDNMFRGLAASVAAYFTVDFASQFVANIARVRGEFQQLEVAFETMLDSKDKADKLMAQVVEFAAKTPFELQEVASGAKSLMAFGVAADDIMGTLKALGDVSAGLSVPIERLILNFGQVKTQAQLTGRELRDFNIAGVPIVAELAKNLNRSEQEIQEMVTAGKIGFKEVNDAFRSMTDEGGRFANLMEKQAKTITGLQSNLRDAWNQMLNDIGKNSEGAIAGTIKAAISLVENYEKVIDILKILVVTYGSYKAAVIAANIAMQTGNYPFIIMQLKNITAAVNAATVSWKAMAVAQKATVVGLAIAGVTALVSALLLLNKKTDEAADFSTQLNNSLSSEITSLNSVFDALKNTNKGTTERNDTIKTINQRYGDYLNNLLDEKSTLEDIETAQKNATDAMIARITVMSSEGELQKQLGDISEKWNDRFGKFTEAYSKTFGADRLPEFIKAINSGIDQEIKNGGGIIERGTLEYSKIAEDIYLRFIADISKSTGALNYTWDEFKTSFLDFAEYKSEKGGTLEYINALIDANKKLTLSSSPEEIQSTIQQQIESTNKALTEARTKLDQLRQSTSKATIDDISSQEQVVKDLEARLSTLTGISKKEAARQVKVEEEKQKALTELADKEIELRNRTETAKIAIMQDGAEKQIKEAELAYKMELQAIKKYRADLLKTYNEAQEKKGLPTVEVLPVQYQSEVDKQTTLAQEKYAAEKIKIETEAAEKIASLWQDVSNELISGKEREFLDIKRYYAERIRVAEEAKDEELRISLLLAQKTAERRVETSYYLDKIDKEEETAERILDIQRDTFISESEFEKKKYDLQVKFIQKKIDYLQKTGANENADEIKNLVEQLNFLRDGFSNFNKVTISESIDNINNLIGSFKNLIEEIYGADSEMSSFMDNIQKMGEATANIMKGDLFGAAGGIFETILGWYRQTVTTAEELKEAERRTREEALALNDTYRNRLKLLESLGLISPMKAFIDDVNILNQKLDIAKNKLSEYSQNYLQNGKATSASIKTIFDTVYGYDWGVNQLNDAMNDWDMLFEKYLQKVGGMAYSNYPLSQFSWIYDKNQFNEDLNYIFETASEIENVVKNLQYTLTGTNTDDIARSIIDGFKEGKKSMADFADSFEELMSQSLINALKTKVLEGPIQSFYEEFALAMDDSALTNDERKNLKNLYSQIIESASQWANGIKELTGVDPFSDALEEAGLTGAIRKELTEETGGLIAGQFMAMRTDLLALRNDLTVIRGFSSEMNDTALNQMSVINQSVTHLANIEKNTRDISLLRETNQKLTEMNTYLKNL